MISQEIRQAIANALGTYSKIANRFGVSEQTVMRIKHEFGKSRATPAQVRANKRRRKKRSK